MWLTCYKFHSKCLTKVWSETGCIGGVQEKEKKQKEQRKGSYNHVSKNDDNLDYHHSSGVVRSGRILD